MIDLTGTMVQLAHEALAPGQVTPPGLIRALRAVLDEIDRHYLVAPRPAPTTTPEVLA